MTEARSALKLCLRQLREGDRFAVLAFDDTIESFARDMVPFTQGTLSRADAWLASIDARGGTELLEPLVQAAKLAPDGIIVVLTDGQVGNDDEILSAFLDARKTARAYSFGIGTNVSDALLVALADRTGGAVEMIHPGERIDEKVVAQFARATAPRVTDLSIKMRGVEVGELAPAEPTSLVDGEPFCLFGTFDEPGIGAVEIRGKLDGEAFYLEVPIDLPEASDRPMVPKLWAQARVRDLERAGLSGRREGAMRDRIVRLAIEHRVSSKYTSFVLVEKRTGDRRVNEQPEARVVPVNPPAGWDMVSKAKSRSRHTTMSGAVTRSGIARPMGAMAPMPYALSRPVSASAPPPPAARSMPRPLGMSPPPPRPASGGPRDDDDDTLSRMVSPERLREADEDDDAIRTLAKGAFDGAVAREEADERTGGDPVLELLSRQAASGLWEDPPRDVVRVTVDALLVVLRLGLTTSHAVYGAQLKKAVDALLAELDRAPPAEPVLVELALGVAYLLASGQRTRRAIEQATRTRALASLAAALGSDEQVSARVDRLAEL